MVALFGSSVRRFWASDCHLVRHAGYRWIKSGQVDTVSYFDTCSCSCNDGYPRAKVTKTSKPPIYSHLHAEQFYLTEDYLKNVIFRARPVHTNSYQLCKQWRHSSDCLAVCIYVIDLSWLMTSQKIYVYFTLLGDGTRRHRHGKFENQWLFPKNDWITLKWSIAAGRLEKNKLGIMVIVEKKRKTDDACLFIFPFWWWIEVLVVFEKKTNKIKIDRKTMIKETLMESKRIRPPSQIC